MYLHAVQSFVWNHIATKRIDAYGSQVIIGDTVQNSSGNVVHVANEEEVKRYSMADVMLALPGQQMMYPKTEKVNESTYEQVLRDLGISNGLAQISFNSPRELQLAGSYRALVIRPQDVHYRLAKYDQEHQVFFSREGTFPPESDFTTGSNEALLLSFKLPPGTYATMATRELLNLGS